MESQDWSIEEVAEACNLIKESTKYVSQMKSLEE